MTVGLNLDLNQGGRDILKQLAGLSINGSNTPLDPHITDLFNKAYGLWDTGLDPATMSALRQESTTGLQDRYESAASDLRTKLLSRGMYGGQLPANSGEILRGFAPLNSALANAQSKAGADTLVANNQALLANRSQALNTVGMGLDLWKNQNQLDLTRLEDAIKAAGANAELEPTSMKNIVMASLLGAGGKLLADPKTWKAIGGMVGLGGAGAGGGFASADDLINAGLATDLGGTGGLGTSLGAFFSSPWTIGIGAALGGAMLWKKSQVHPTADTWTHGFQNPFDQHMGQIDDQFFQLASQGKLTLDQAKTARGIAADTIDHYKQQLAEFEKKGSKEKTVASQARDTFNHWYGNLLSSMDAVIAQLGGGQTQGQPA